MTYAIGIDLGTTNSVASVFRRGATETLLIDGGRTLLPSVISLKSDGTLLVGQPAKSRLLIDPDASVASAKTYMGDPTKRYQLGGKSYTPVDVAAIILKRIIDGASNALGERVTDAVITVPAYFTEDQKANTKRAAEQAGINVLQLLPEPTAAAISYGLDQGKNQTLLVYDLGGGTFDVSILAVEGNQFLVKAVGGDSRLGGDDFDNAMIGWMTGKAQGAVTTGGGKAALENMRAKHQRLKEKAERAKIELSEAEAATIMLDEHGGTPMELQLTLDEYNGLIASLLQKTADCVLSTLRDAHLEAEDISRVLLVGGSTKNRAVRQLVTEMIKEPFVAPKVDEVVSHGAAILAAQLMMPTPVKLDDRPAETDERPTPITLQDVTAHSLGIAIIDSDSGQDRFHKIIPRQSPYPCRMSFVGTTVNPMQTAVRLTVYRGEEYDPPKNTRLGELILPILHPSPGEIPVGAIFHLNEDGIIAFTAVTPTTPKDIPAFSAATRDDGTFDLEAADDLIAKRLGQSIFCRIDSRK